MECDCPELEAHTSFCSPAPAPPLATLSSSQDLGEEVCGGGQMCRCPQQLRPQEVAGRPQACVQELCGQFL